MSEIKIFNVGETVEEIKPAGSLFSKSIQQIIENNSKKIFGVSLVASNYQIGSGRVATVGLDENRCPVIFVYSLDDDKNFLSKGLYALEQVDCNNSLVKKRYQEHIEELREKLV